MSRTQKEPAMSPSASGGGEKVSWINHLKNFVGLLMPYWRISKVIGFLLNLLDTEVIETSLVGWYQYWKGSSKELGNNHLQGVRGLLWVVAPPSKWGSYDFRKHSCEWRFLKWYPNSQRVRNCSHFNVPEWLLEALFACLIWNINIRIMVFFFL